MYSQNKNNKEKGVLRVTSHLVSANRLHNVNEGSDLLLQRFVTDVDCGKL
jgi:hypothetical protein